MEWWNGDRRFELAIYRGHYLQIERRPNLFGKYELKVRVPNKLARIFIDASDGAHHILTEWRSRVRVIDVESSHEIMSCGKEVEECVQSVDEVADWLIDKINESNIDWSVDKVILIKCLSRE